ncbi:Cell division control protein 2-like protein A [Diplonema papillatum]|nr:Cell division control protein 2-like protein A [Diplonema papillatum]
MTGIASPGLHWFEESDLEVHGKLGEGSYGAVHRVKSKATGAWLAVKKVGAEWFDYGLPPSTMREIATLAQLGPHPNIVRLFGVMESADSEFLLCFELCEGGDLNDRLEEYCGRAVDSQASGSSVGSAQPKRVGIPLARSIIGQVSSGLAHMHRHSLMHRDVKPMNILTDKPLHTVKICDFGMVRHAASPDRLVSREAMTVYYRAPEVMMGCFTYGLPCDVWSAGCVFAEVLCHGCVAFDEETEVEMLFRMFSVLGTPTEQSWPEAFTHPDWNNLFPSFPALGLGSLAYFEQMPSDAFDLLRRLLVLNPKARITMEDVLRHPFLADGTGSKGC